MRATLVLMGASAASALALAGCDPAPSCGDADFGRPLWAAVGGPGVALADGDLSVAVSGTVESAGTGAAPDVDGGLLSLGREAGAPDPWWIRFRTDAGETWTATVAAGGSRAPAVGAKLTVRAEASMSFQGTSGSVRITLADGTLVTWLGEAYAVRDLMPPDPVTLGVGATLCQVSEDCGDSSAHSLVAVVGEATDVIPYGAWRTVADAVIHNGGVMVDDAPKGCPDFSRGHALVAVSPAP